MITESPPPSGQTVAITGAGSGLGAAMADLFAGQGARLALFDIDEERVKAKAAELCDRGVEAFGFRIDGADKLSIEAAADAFKVRYGSCEVLCANVGVQQFGAIEALTEHDWQWVMSVNFHGVINTVSAFLPMLRKGKGRRHIVLTSSASFFQTGIRMAAYVASKFAVVGYGEVLRRELAPEGINVALLFPAGMATRHVQSSIAARPPELGPSRIDMEDVQAMMADAGIDPAEHVTSPEYAVRNLLHELDAGRPYIITHGNYRHQVESQQREILAAFDAMAMRT
jgi:NAD(P)-dependent dehydrogenase (short-subunit alcohol dehydrogenase family)